MCQLFIKADPDLWRQKLRSVRLSGFSTSVRLENIYWRLLQDIAAREKMSVNAILARLYEELLETQGEVDNFASFLRVCCARYLMLQLAGDIPADPTQPIAGLDAPMILAREKARLGQGDGWAEPPPYLSDAPAGTGRHRDSPRSRNKASPPPAGSALP
ncbi:aryl-sulfate sulfotransferase [Rhodoblastus sphagnicola]|uniref:Aryl-sulfate sulfotransferase n=1 Tax=Rhodoblastus sphagnicola TaxID=333368 RepID=A0A2S6N029_9HYPH|nr:putative DNA-binding ribbon-helix-helix protein [Rhodoblastus sphagnicola]PPQ27962.1 aryl-sulfate sulfotransferase [Rhodoblastus sphagnicola]